MPLLVQKNVGQVLDGPKKERQPFQISNLNVEDIDGAWVTIDRKKKFVKGFSKIEQSNVKRVYSVPRICNTNMHMSAGAKGKSRE